MDDAPATRASLLVRIRDGRDAEAWKQFVRLYAPVVYGFARKRGLQDADAADLMQDVLRSVATAAVRLEYDPDRGSFRGWLFTVTRNKVFNFLESGKRRERGAGDSDAQKRLEEEPDRSDAAPADWDREYERQMAARAMDLVKEEFQPATWQAFWLTGVEGRPAKEAAEKTGLSVGAVYVAKSRALARLRAVVQRLEDGLYGRAAL
jgi:RNA polymerase sigma-70 factor (ECF subfamily)